MISFQTQLAYKFLVPCLRTLSHLTNHAVLTVKQLSEIDNTLVTVPMKIDKPGEATEEAAFVAGIVGYKTEKEEDETWPRVSSVHSWTLLLKPHSVYRYANKCIHKVG